MSRIYFGIAGWSYPDWKGVVYGPGRMDELSYLVQYFDTIELNNTFYRIPGEKMVESWARRVTHNPDFRFTAKLWQGFTHESSKELQQPEIKQFLEAMEPLRSADRLGALLIQFPFSFKNDKRNQDRISALVDAFGSRFPLVVEFRNREWITPETYGMLEEKGVGFCNVDEPQFRSMIKPSATVTGPTGYVRFHGRNYQNWFSKTANRDSRYDYLYSEGELDEWVPKIRQMREKAKDVYVIGNNHFRGQAPTNILQLKSKVMQGPVDVPEGLLTAFPELKKIAMPQQRTKSVQKKHREQPDLE